MRGLSKEEIIKNLQDAGCSDVKIKIILGHYKNGNKENIHNELSIYRKQILEDEHRIQRKIDCIDFFLYKIEKEGKNNKY